MSLESISSTDILEFPWEFLLLHVVSYHSKERLRTIPKATITVSAQLHPRMQKQGLYSHLRLLHSAAGRESRLQGEPAIVLRMAPRY